MGATEFVSIVECLDEAEREERIRDLVSKMSLWEKLHEMTGNFGPIRLFLTVVRYGLIPSESGGNRRRGIPKLIFTDGPRGIMLNRSTCFPAAIARGASWDLDLAERIGDVLGAEARSQGANFYGGVCINLLRHPGWGRAQETFGEEPYLLGMMGAAEIKGLKRHVMACAKHYACNSIEEARFYVDVRIDERTLREVYLPHFKKCVDAGAASIMSAYNRVNGDYCGENVHLLREILKTDWGFDGFVMSDFFWGVYDGVKGAKAGLDMEMPSARKFGIRLYRAVKKGLVDEALIDEAVVRILRKKAEYAAVGEPERYGKGQVACQAHRELALEAARKGIVLLKNDGGALPFAREGLRRIAVFGRLARRKNIGDMGSSRVRPPYVVTPLEGIRKKAAGVEVVFDPGKNLGRVAELAAHADAVVVVAGLTWRDEGEYVGIGPVGIGCDRENLDLSPAQEALILAAAEKAKKCVVVLEGGSAITMEKWKDKVDAILMAWYPGMEGGTAIAEVLFGEVNPSGKLPVTFPKSTDDLPFFDRKAKRIEYGYFHGYRLFDKEGRKPAFPFGFGLSYTQFSYENLSIEKASSGNEGVEISCDVGNIGGREGAEVVQLYVGYENSSIERPVKELKGFSRVDLKPGEKKRVSFVVRPDDLAYYDAESASWRVEDIEYNGYVGSSSAKEDIKLAGSFKLGA